MDITLWIELVLFVVLMGFSAFFSSSETSLFSLSKFQREQMRRDENPRLGLIEKLLSEPRRLIVTILIGNEFVNVAASVISAAIVIRLFGAENKLVNLFIMVPILLLVGEITPKTLAIRNNIAFASVQAKPIEWFSRLITPLRWIVRLVAEWFTTLIVGKELNPGSIVTQDMVRTLAQEAVGDGVLDSHEARYIEKIFNFGDKTVAEVMTPRSRVLFLPADMPFEQLLQQLKQSKHTKVPLYTGHRDNISGFLHSRDLISVDLEELQQKPALLQGILREPHFVPETKSASELFQTFRKRKLSVALVVDEYGGVTGLVSMEDMLECIFGDIPSASDTIDATGTKRLDDGTTRVVGAMTISQFNQQIGGLPENPEFDTVAGLVLHELGELPVEGTGIVIGDIEFTVDKVDNNRIQTLTLKHYQPDTAATNEGTRQRGDSDADASGRDD